jgi:hypothetical protein
MITKQIVVAGIKIMNIVSMKYFISDSKHGLVVCII